MIAKLAGVSVIAAYPHSMPDSSSNSSAAGRPLLREAIVAAVCVSFGAFVLPAMIYAVGVLLLGQYTGGLGKFYANFFQDLLAGLPRTWALVLGPYLLITLLRAIFAGRGARSPANSPDGAAPQPELRTIPLRSQVQTTVRSAAPRTPVVSQDAPSRQAKPGSKRIEPRISLD